MGKPKAKPAAAKATLTTGKKSSARHAAKSLALKSAARDAKKTRQTTISTNLLKTGKIGLEVRGAAEKPVSGAKKRNARDSASSSSSFVLSEPQDEKDKDDDFDDDFDDVEDVDKDDFIKPSTQPTYVTLSGRISHKASFTAKSPLNNESSADEYTQSSRSVAFLQSAAASRNQSAAASRNPTSSKKRPAPSSNGSPVQNSRSKRSIPAAEALNSSISKNSSILKKSGSSIRKPTASSPNLPVPAAAAKRDTSRFTSRFASSKSKSAPNSPQSKSKRLSKVSSSKHAATGMANLLPTDEKKARKIKSAPPSAPSSPPSNNNNKKNSSNHPKSLQTTSRQHLASSSNSSPKNKKKIDQAITIDSLSVSNKVKEEKEGQSDKIASIPAADQHVREKPAGSTSCDQCRAAKKGCVGGVPCTRCITRGKSCTFQNPPKRPPGWGRASIQKPNQVPAIRAAGLDRGMGISAQSRDTSIVKKKVAVRTAHRGGTARDTLLGRKKPPHLSTTALKKIQENGPVLPVQRQSPVQIQPQTVDDYVAFFGNKLSKEDADISKCMPTKADIDMFDAATAIVKKREEKLKVAPVLYIPPPPPPVPLKSPGRKRKSESPKKSLKSSKPTSSALAAPGSPTHTHHHIVETSSLLPRIPTLQIGRFRIDTWYAAPYPEEFMSLPTVYLCTFCLKPVKSLFTLQRHLVKCVLKRPPGDEVYRDGTISIFEVDGRKNKIYCQNLCLLAKTFLDHKTLYYDVEPFLFYIMCERGQGEGDECFFVGYFSKEKRSTANYNVSCILTLPTYQRKGYGSFLIDFSYLLSRKEGVPGSPEKPLSDLGLLSYRHYWRGSIIRALMSFKGKRICIDDLVEKTGMTPEDVSRTLSELDALYKDDDDEYAIRYAPAVYAQEIARLDAKGYLKVRPECLKWTPFIFKQRQIDMKKDQREVMRLLEGGGGGRSSVSSVSCDSPLQS